jgi:mono/diheme cytochrome c family protein
MRIAYPKILGLFLSAALAAPVSAGPSADKKALERGRYIVATSGCNDCHTPGYMQKDGDVPEAEWLTGDSLGWQGPWGTTYPANLRLLAQGMSEQAWLVRTRQAMRPPMPTPSLRAMTDADLRAVYQYIRSLGAKGIPAPAYVPPGQKVSTPYFEFVPKNLPQKNLPGQAAAKQAPNFQGKQ